MSGDVEGREERLEHARAAGRVDSGTRVAHPDLGAAVPKAPRRERDAARIRRELDGVQQEVAQTIPDLFALQLHGAEALAVVPNERLVPQRDERTHLLGGALEQGEEVERLPCERPLELLHGEHGGEIVDATLQPVRGRGDLHDPPVQRLRNVVRPRGEMGEEHEDREWRPELVARHPDEVGLELAGRRQLGVGAYQLLVGPL